MSVPLDDARRERLIAGLQGFFVQEFDDEISRFQAERVLEYFLESLGPALYNQAVQDARGYMQRKLDELDGEVHAPERL